MIFLELYGSSKVNKFKFATRLIFKNNISVLDVSVDNALRVQIVNSIEQLFNS